MFKTFFRLVTLVRLRNVFPVILTGTEICLLDSDEVEKGQERKDEDKSCPKTGELFIVPPSIGLSTTLINKEKEHSIEYFKETPLNKNGIKLRRHGDEFRRIEQNYFKHLGRVDDTFNIGGIKVNIFPNLFPH